MVLTEANAERRIAGFAIRKAEPQFLGTFMALYGQGGAGKTTLAAELYKLGKTILIDREGGTDSIENLVKEENLDVIDIYNWRDFTRIIESLVRDSEEYTNIIVDNLCEIIDDCEDAHGIKGDDSHDLQKYKLVKRDILRYVKLLRDLCRKRRVNVIICAWDADEKDDKGVVKKDLAFTPALRKEFPGICTIIGHIKVLSNPDLRTLDFAPSPKSVCKFKRSIDSPAQKVPYKITYGIKNLPLADVLNTIKGEDWPASKYAKVEVD